MTKGFMLGVRATLRATAKIIGVGTLLVVSACGGGGGDSSSISPPPAPAPAPTVTDNSMRVVFDTGALAMAYDQGDPSPKGAIINATTQGTPSGKVFIGATTPTGRPDPNISSLNVAITGTSARIFVNPAAGLSPGTYSGTLVLQACTDAACAVHYAGSPWSVSYSLSVARVIQVSPASISLSGTSGVPSQKAVAVTLPADVANYTVTSDSPWLSADQITPTGFLLKTQGVHSGILTGVLTLQGGGLTKTVPVEYVVTPQRLATSTTSVNLTAQSGATAAAQVQVTLPEGANDYAIADASLPRWLGIVDRTASGFRFVAAAMPSGRYTTTVSVSSQSQVVPVDISYTVAAPSGGDRYLSVGMKSVTLGTAEGSISPSVELGLVRPSWNSNVSASVSYPVGAPGGWLTQRTSASGDMVLSASAANLPKGNYSASLLLTPAYPGSPITVPVALTVGAGMATPASQIFTITSDTTASQLSGTVPVVFNGVTAAHWKATTSTPWLNLTRASGGVGESIAFNVNVAALPSPIAFTKQTATVDLTATTDSGLAITPTQTSITLQFQLAEVYFATPTPVIAGQTGSILVRGRGFGLVPNMASKLTLNGVTPTAVTTVNDTQLSVTLPGLAAGSYVVGVSNSLGLKTATTSLHAVDPIAKPYSAFNTSILGSPRTLIYDAVHGDVYASYPPYGGGLSAVARFRPTASGWTTATLSVPGLIDIALAPDATVLAATDSSNTVNLIDLSSFSITSRYVAPDVFVGQGDLLEVRIAFTNDGKLWIPTGQYSWHEIGYFDLRTRSFGKASPPCPTCYDGPYFAVSRDGSRLMVAQSGSISSEPPMLYLDAVDDILRPNPIGLTFFNNHTSLSDTGDRFLMAGLTVYDRSFGTIGSVPSSVRSDMRAAQLSPDGRRAYLLRYEVSSGGSPSGPVTVTVIDTSPPAGQQANLAVLGSFTLPDAPGCRLLFDYDLTSCSRPKMRVTPDGNNLLLLGNTSLIVAPIPPALSGSSKAMPVQWSKTLLQR